MVLNLDSPTGFDRRGDRSWPYWLISHISITPGRNRAICGGGCVHLARSHAMPGGLSGALPGTTAAINKLKELPAGKPGGLGSGARLPIVLSSLRRCSQPDDQAAGGWLPVCPGSLWLLGLGGWFSGRSISTCRCSHPQDQVTALKPSCRKAVTRSSRAHLFTSNRADRRALHRAVSPWLRLYPTLAQALAAQPIFGR